MKNVKFYRKTINNQHIIRICYQLTIKTGQVYVEYQKINSYFH